MAKNRKSTKSLKRRTGSSSIIMKCKTCDSNVENVDIDSKSVICYKCVARQLNPNAIFVDELSPKEWVKLKSKNI